jgi:hypothetical protein
MAISNLNNIQDIKIYKTLIDKIKNGRINQPFLKLKRNA